MLGSVFWARRAGRQPDHRKVVAGVGRQSSPTNKQILGAKSAAPKRQFCGSKTGPTARPRILRPNSERTACPKLADPNFTAPIPRSPPKTPPPCTQLLKLRVEMLNLPERFRVRPLFCNTLSVDSGGLGFRISGRFAGVTEELGGLELKASGLRRPSLCCIHERNSGACGFGEVKGGLNPKR